MAVPLPSGEEGDLTPLQTYEFEFNMAARGRVKFNQRKAVKEMQKTTAISQAMYSQILHGRSSASPEHCYAFSRYFRLPLERVLKDFGHTNISVDYLIVAVEGRRDLEDQENILKMLKLACHVLWRELTDWRTSTYKDKAEYFLTRNIDPIEKARFYADEVWDWVWAMERRNQSRAQRNSDEALAVVDS
jgi:hypothetical protein